MTVYVDDMTPRKEFEAWKQASGTGGLGLGRSTEPGHTENYENPHTQGQWIAWQAAQQAQQIPPQHATPQMQLAGGAVTRELSGEPIGWLDAARVWSVMYAEFLKSGARTTTVRERCATIADGAHQLPNDGSDFANGWCSAALQIAQAIRMVDAPNAASPNPPKPAA